MALWAEKYRPVALGDLTYHDQLSAQLDLMCMSDGFPHMLVYGPSGAGKKTRIMATLRQLFGPGVEKIKLDSRTITAPSGKKIEMPLLLSTYHMELNPTDIGTQDRVVVQELIKEMAKTQNIDSAARQRFKVVVISDADALSLPAQHALRRTMEKYIRNLRIILCCTSTSKIIPAIQSRCMLVRVPAPSHEEICSAIKRVAGLQEISLADELICRLTIESKRNLRRALLMLEALFVVNGSPSSLGPTVDTSVVSYDWETYIAQTVTQMVREQTPESLLSIRERIYELLSHCIPPSIIIKTMALFFASKVDEVLRPRIVHEAAHYEHYNTLGTKPIYHIEAFVAKIMCVYKQYCFDVVSGTGNNLNERILL